MYGCEVANGEGSNLMTRIYGDSYIRSQTFGGYHMLMHLHFLPLVLTYLYTQTRLVSKTREPEDVSQDLHAAGERCGTDQARARGLAKCPTRVQARAHM